MLNLVREKKRMIGFRIDFSNKENIALGPLGRQEVVEKGRRAVVDAVCLLRLLFCGK